MTDRDPGAFVTFSWGMVGHSRWEVLLRDRAADRDGVVRTVEPGVEYVLDAPEAAGVVLPFPRWHRRPDGRYEMDLGGSEPPRVVSLAQLRETLHRGRWRGDEADLAMLDVVATDLLRIVGELHAQGIGVGLLQPANVLIHPGPNADWSLILPDVGFVSARGLLPEWIRQDVAFRELWDSRPETMNRSVLDPSRYPKLTRRIGDLAAGSSTGGLDPVSDLRTVARLLAWVLAPDGKVRRKIPRPDEGPWARAEIWYVLGLACGGAFGDAHTFAEAIHDAPPSRHFLAENAAPPEPRGRRSAWVVIGVLVLALGAAALGIKSWKGVGEPASASIRHTLCPECPRSSKLQGLIGEYARAAQDGGGASGDPPQESLEEERLRREYLVLKKLYDPSLLDERRPYQELERACRDRLFESTLNRLDALGFRLAERVRDAGQPDAALRSRVDAMKDLYVSLLRLRHPFTPISEGFPTWFETQSGPPPP